jgi:hypothetical protein
VQVARDILAEQPYVSLKMLEDCVTVGYKLAFDGQLGHINQAAAPRRQRAFQ